MSDTAARSDKNTTVVRTDEDTAEISTLTEHECHTEGEMSTKRRHVSTPRTDSWLFSQGSLVDKWNAALKNIIHLVRIQHKAL